MMNVPILHRHLFRKISRRWFFLSRSRIRLPGRRVLLTADLDEPVFCTDTKQLLELCLRHRAALTLFTPNRSENGEETYPVLEHIREFALEHNLKVEFASHSMTHNPLPRRNPAEAASIIGESVASFRGKGIPVSGFRSPYLSTQNEYRTILKELARREERIQYDSSTLFEGNFFISRIHDFLSWKSPHPVAGIWELPISCLDDYHLFEKFNVKESRVLAYWKHKVDRSLRKCNYFLLLIHPHMMGKHLTVLDNLIDYCRKVYLDLSFVTCHQLVEELDAVGKERY